MTTLFTPKVLDSRVDRGPAILHNLTLAVSRGYRDRGSSIEAVALFVRTAQHLGYVAEPYGVAILLQDRSSQRIACVGRRALDVAPAAVKRDERNLPHPGWAGAGHVVAFVPKHRLLIDPALPQLKERGVEAPPLIGTLRTMETPDGRWHFTLKQLDINYIHVPDDHTWHQVYQQNYDVHEATSQALAEALQSGVKPEDIHWGTEGS